MDVDHAAGLQFTWEPESPVLFLAFGGMQIWREVPRFEWRHAFEGLPVNRLLVRDLAQYWYLRGVSGVAGDIAASACALRRLLAERDIRRVVCLGASTGGFAALIYGALLGADEVHAFSPVCFLPSRPLIQVAAQTRRSNWRLLLKHVELRCAPATARDHYDLRPILHNDSGRTHYFIYHGSYTPDVRNAQHLAGLPRVTLQAYAFPGHDLVGHMRDTGALAAVLNEAFARVTATPTP